jgi:hypothetical protein
LTDPTTVIDGAMLAGYRGAAEEQGLSLDAARVDMADV